jgi:hypothetical protein
VRQRAPLGTLADTLRLFVIRSEIPFVDGQSAGCAPPV